VRLLLSVIGKILLSRALRTDLMKMVINLLMSYFDLVQGLTYDLPTPASVRNCSNKKKGFFLSEPINQFYQIRSATRPIYKQKR